MNDSELQILNHEIRTCIYEVRGRKVMIDYHLAKLYRIENRVLKQAVRRNIERFPEDFMFSLTQSESNQLISKGVSQSVIPTGYNTGRSAVLAFTEEGVSMLSAVLRSEVAVKMSIAIIRVFVSLRNTLGQLNEQNLKLEQITNRIQQLQIDMDDILRDQNDINEDMRKQQDNIVSQLDRINDAIAELQAEKNQKLLNSQRNPIGFNITKQ